LSEGVVTFSLLLSFSFVGVVIFTVAVVTPDYTVAVAPTAVVHKEKAVGVSSIPESP